MVLRVERDTSFALAPFMTPSTIIAPTRVLGEYVGELDVDRKVGACEDGAAVVGTTGMKVGAPGTRGALVGGETGALLGLVVAPKRVKAGEATTGP